MNFPGQDDIVLFVKPGLAPGQAGWFYLDIALDYRHITVCLLLVYLRSIEFRYDISYVIRGS